MDMGSQRRLLHTLNIYEKKQQREIVEIKIPQEIVISEKHQDIGLIRTTEKIEMLPNMQPVKLPGDANVFQGIL